MEMKNKNRYVYLLFGWIFAMSFSSCATDDVNYIVVKNLRDLANNHLTFKTFYKVYVEESYLNDRRKCNNCLMIGGAHNFYDLLNITADEKCFGTFDSCVVDQKPETETFIIGTKVAQSSSEVPIVYEVAHTCGSCICYCYGNTLHRDRKNSIDSICIDPISVDASKKQVVIGFRFIQVRNMLMMQLKRGQVQDEQSIARGSGEWLEPPTQCKKAVQLNHNNSFFLMDDSMLPDNHVVTGIAMRKCDHKWTFSGKTIRSIMNCEGNFFYLTVYGTSMTNVLNGTDSDIIEGTLKGPKSLRERVDLTNDDMLPSEFAPTNTLQQIGNFFIKFRPTSWTQDKGKHIIPYLNSQPIEARPSKSLRGIGILYSGTESYGGFISPVLYARRN